MNIYTLLIHIIIAQQNIHIYIHINRILFPSHSFFLQYLKSQFGILNDANRLAICFGAVSRRK